MFVAERETKRGLLESACHHIAIGQPLLAATPNTWLQAMGESLLMAIALLRSDLEAAQLHGQKALALSERSGRATVLRAALANLGNLAFARGEFDSAINYFRRAQCALPAFGEKTGAVLESIAAVLMMRGQLQDSADVLDQIDSSLKSNKERVLYGYRYAELTRTQLRTRQGLTEDALLRADFVLDLARASADARLQVLATLARADLLFQLDRSFEGASELSSALGALPNGSPELFAQVNQIIACGLRRRGSAQRAGFYYERANLIYRTLRSAPGAMELRRCWEASQPVGDAAAIQEPLESDRAINTNSLSESMLQSMTTLMRYPDRAELVAAELIDLLSSIEGVESVLATSEHLVPAGSSKTANEEAGNSWSEQRIPIGRVHDREIILAVRMKPGIESVATINAVRVIASALAELRQIRKERLQRSTLWPIEDVSTGTDAIISGQIREQMTFAKKVAATNINVLITGESGTGKEIIARAIHEFSDRATKPFVPLNCTAVPRDLLESHLFGHRRGAFTGADRDQPGLIRSAHGGTLFLDEIGELNLELQPKLLRFLESGEIAPLGERAPVNVNVRIVAATNANLEDAVRDGKFREDLFYRLNVVRLSLKPLRERRDEIPGFVSHFVARAAAELDKGQLTVADETVELLLLYRWPGNVRQLQNEIRRMVALAERNSTLAPDMISEQILGVLPIVRTSETTKRTEIAVQLSDKLQPTLQRIECEMIKAAFREHHGKVEAVAKSLGISRKGLYLKRQRLGL